MNIVTANYTMNIINIITDTHAYIQSKRRICSIKITRSEISLNNNNLHLLFTVALYIL